MGMGRWDPEEFGKFTAKHTAGRSAAAVFTTSSRLDEFDPSKFGVRESRDSAKNPLSTAISLWSDVTGSMGVVAEAMIRNGLDTVMREIYRRKPVTDPHVLVGAVGDAYCDRAPIQMTQYEADVGLADQLKRIWIEGGGGGNQGESYLAAHWAAGMKTSIDCFEKRGRKGFMFTMGDEPNLATLTKAQVRDVFGVASERDLTAKECLALAQRSHEVFHLVFRNVGYARHDLAGVTATWKPLLGERMILVDDHTKVAEIVVSTLQVLAGEKLNDVASSWSGDTSLVVANALGALATSKGQGKGGVRRL